MVLPLVGGSFQVQSVVVGKPSTPCSGEFSKSSQPMGLRMFACKCEVQGWRYSIYSRWSSGWQKCIIIYGNISNLNAKIQRPVLDSNSNSATSLQISCQTLQSLTLENGWTKEWYFGWKRTFLLLQTFPNKKLNNKKSSPSRSLKLTRLGVVRSISRTTRPVTKSPASGPIYRLTVLGLDLRPPKLALKKIAKPVTELSNDVGW